MELELGLALPNNNHLMKGLDLNDGNTTKSYRKRDFEEAFEEAITLSSPLPRKTTLPLFVHKNGGDGDTDDENDSPQLKYSHEHNRALVGWPPIKHPRRRSTGGGAEERWGEGCGSNSDDGGGCRRAKCVKVKMEGVAIGRKVDLSLHDSYDELFLTLNQMFPNMRHGVAHHHHHHHTHHRDFMVTYEDGEGDWLLVGDVPWEAFIQSVKRLKILG